MTDVLDEAAALSAAADDQLVLGDLAACRRLAAQAALLLRGFVGEGPDVRRVWCQVQEQLAELDRLEDDVPAAEHRLGEVLEVATAELGPTSDEVVSANNSLGVVLKAAGRLDDAAAAYRRACRAFGPDDARDLQVAATLCHNLAGLDHARGRAEAGIVHGERGLALRKAAVGDDHPDVARDLDNLGALYQLAGRLHQAAVVHRRALDIFEATYGPDHLEVGMALANLAVVATAHGRDAEAEACNRRSLAILGTVFGPEHPEVGLTLHNLAVSVADQGRDAEAAALLEQALAILESALPADHPVLASVRGTKIDLVL